MIGVSLITTYTSIIFELYDTINAHWISYQLEVVHHSNI